MLAGQIRSAERTGEKGNKKNRGKGSLLVDTYVHTGAAELSVESDTKSGRTTTNR